MGVHGGIGGLREMEGAGEGGAEGSCDGGEGAEAVDIQGGRGGDRQVEGAGGAGETDEGGRDAVGAEEGIWGMEGVGVEGGGEKA